MKKGLLFMLALAVTAFCSGWNDPGWIKARKEEKESSRQIGEDSKSCFIGTLLSERIE